jgi:hypothetical protein
MPITTDRLTHDPAATGTHETLYPTDVDRRPSPPRGRSSMVEPQSSKLATRVRFPSPAPESPQLSPLIAGRLAYPSDRLSPRCHPDRA